MKEMEPSSLSINESKILYVDAGTQNNGQRGRQRTIIVVCDENGLVLLERWIGDYTNNEGEIIAIKNALEEVAPDRQKMIYSDSTIAVGWTLRGWKPKLRNKHRNTVGKELNDRLALCIEQAGKLLRETKSSIEWIPREDNLAGHYIEKTFDI